MRLLPVALLASCAAMTHAPGPSPRPSMAAPVVTVVDAGSPDLAVAALPADAGASVALDEPDAGEELVDSELTGGEEPGEGAEVVSEEPGEVASAIDADAGWLYTTDLSDDALVKAWRESPAALGSISMGFVEEGRLINGVPFPTDDAWTVVSPDATWGTHETVDFVAAAIRQVKAWHPDAPPLRVNQISAREGGYLRPHKTHQNGRDVDLGFYYPGGQTVRVREREKVIDVALNWALVKALVLHGDVQFILVDQRVQKVLEAHARKAGEDPAWLDSLFHAGRGSILQHARRHRDHFHVRYFNGRAQELGRRVAPLLAERPEENIAMHRVRKGDTLGGIAGRYGSSVAAIRKASGLSNNLLRIGRVLKVPLRKPCTTCPVPPPTLVPPRRLPPGIALAPQVEPPAAPLPVVLASDAGVLVAPALVSVGLEPDAGVTTAAIEVGSSAADVKAAPATGP
ncbi:MAG: penicillin-insensitive murein endopeptidase [Myxococcaceae bacterium]|nr:penicillin-insensitive murein endopeptidase [Myxococcaceae bacterium]